MNDVMLYMKEWENGNCCVVIGVILWGIYREISLGIGLIDWS